ncbi:MAG: 4Fe-4S dicluster domain-containing protein [Candidatus Aminicenantes bacterium]|nr:4Fe-4S dicluster domain-containing protein [Candidatus Aminicenantes bacterium]
MAKRKIIEIERDLCNGCGLCTTACMEGALVLDAENKAVLVRELYCDGMGACLAVCPTGALKIIERDSETYDPKKTYQHVLKTRGEEAAGQVHGAMVSGRSELTQWPIQLHLVSPFAPYFQNADLLIAADCTAFALGGFHPDLLKGKKIVIACPKLDDTSNYAAKISEIIKLNDLRSLIVAIMTVPCCSGLVRIVEDAVARAGSTLVVNKVVIGIDGKLAS